MTVYKINDYDMVIEDRVNGIVRVNIFNRSETLKPITWVIEYGKKFIDEFTTMVLYRTNDEFKKDFIEYCKKYNIFQEILEEVERVEIKEKELLSFKEVNDE